MKINWDQNLTGRDGTTLTIIKEEGGKDLPVTLKELLCNALDYWDQRREFPGTEKYERYKIIKKINEGEALDVKEIGTIIKAVEQFTFFPYVYGQIMDILNQKEEDKPALTSVEGGKA